jgi:hypothetical protein
VILGAVRMAKKHLYREFWEDRFKRMGSHTLESCVMGKRIIVTDDPENIKAILATQFHDYGRFYPLYPSPCDANGLSWWKKAKGSHSTSSGNPSWEIASFPRTARHGRPLAS